MVLVLLKLGVLLFLSKNGEETEVESMILHMIEFEILLVMKRNKALCERAEATFCLAR